MKQYMDNNLGKGERKLTEEQLQKTHEFLSGKHVKTVADIMKEE